ncbi:putative ABC transport system permease protein [Catalinimonas alkaloidigena]|uniref:Putative ABC transport system permease protein n=1 Tax=Catalinimonas alkaloidigena TaxID=1075417 RepID=A0A1G9ILZ6_9BACT|nr:ABC transporter permease [Catalinimonas alkaloidigena]SDL26106.1 putative ABC transport system permease protein [Catalinimonas alkaloidigena]
MLRNFFTLAVRNLLKRKVYSFINLFGLALGVAVCLVILKYVEFELSYDRFHENAAQIYRTTTATYRNGEFRGVDLETGYAQGPLLQADIPEVKTYVRTHPMYGGAVVTYQDEVGMPTTFYEESMQFVDSTFFDVFTYTAAQGNLHTALDRPNSVVISPAMAKKYFGQADPLGKIVQVSGGWADGEYEVTAVLEEVPQNSHFTFEFLFPIHNLLQGGQYRQDDGWGWQNFFTYIQLQPHTDVATAEAKMPAFITKYQGDDLAETNSKAEMVLQPLPSIHLNQGLPTESGNTSETPTVYFFLLISFFILAIAWINYINLSTARAMERAREVGIKKAIGAYRSQLMLQFIFESVLVNLISIVLAVLIALALLPLLGEMVGKALTFEFRDYRFWLMLTTLFLLGSLISGAYPAFVLSSFNTIQVLKGSVRNVQGGFSLRKALVVFQFAASLVLIAGTFAIYRQVVYMRDQDKGLTMDQMLVVNGPKVLERDGSTTRLLSLKRELQQLAGVEAVTTSGAIPGGGHNWGTGMRRDGTPPEEAKSGRVVWVDPDFVDTYGITVLAGRNFNLEMASDLHAVLVNEAALTAFGLGDPEHALEERLILGGDTIPILGVLKNYHWSSLKMEHTPWLFLADTVSQRAFSIHLTGTDLNGTIQQVEQKYKAAFPGNPFDYYFLDDFFNRQYQSEQQFAQIFTSFATLAIVIACLGLWGLASFTTTLKLKEISIRKVLGASVSSILSLLSWQFLQLVLIASLIALPLTWYGVDAWLQNFAFRMGLGWELFVVPVLILGLLALGTVSVQILRGANTNPAKILRSE